MILAFLTTFEPFDDLKPAATLLYAAILRPGASAARVWNFGVYPQQTGLFSKKFHSRRDFQKQLELGTSLYLKEFGSADRFCIQGVPGP